MGIINLHPQSFSQIGRIPETKRAIAYAKQLLAEGADILDIGAEPTNPGVTQVPTAAEECAALLPVIHELVNTTSAIISIDTSQAEVMQAVIAAGVHMINDVRALTQPNALAVVAKSQVGVCLMHHLALTDTTPWVAQVNDVLQARAHACMDQGISAERLCIDPGLGGYSATFHKTAIQNKVLLQNLAHITVNPQRPCVIGLSRKGFIGRWMSPGQPVGVSERLPGSLAASLWAVQSGAKIIRTHDVAATVQAIRVWQLLAQ